MFVSRLLRAAAYSKHARIVDAWSTLGALAGCVRARRRGDYGARSMIALPGSAERAMPMPAQSLMQDT